MQLQQYLFRWKEAITMNRIVNDHLRSLNQTVHLLQHFIAVNDMSNEAKQATA